MVPIYSVPISRSRTVTRQSERAAGLSCQTALRFGVPVIACSQPLNHNVSLSLSRRLGRAVASNRSRQRASSAISRLLVYESLQYDSRNENRVNGNHFDQSLSFSQKNGNSLTWVLVALTVCFTYPVLYRVSSESRAGEWEL